MNRKTLGKLIVLAICSVLVFTLIPSSGGSVLYLLALPFALIAKGLRALSLSGSNGNMIAILLYAVVSLSPMLFLLKKKRSREDWLLIACSGALFYVLYLLINPGLMPAAMSSEVGGVIYSGTIYSILISWGILKLIHREVSGYDALKTLLYILAALYIIVGFGVGVGDLKTEIVTLHTTNTMPGQNLLPTDLFHALIFAVHALEYLMDACLMIFGVDLICQLEQNPYSESCVETADLLSRKARSYLSVILLSNMALNVTQVLFAYNLYNIDAKVRIPVFSVALCLGCMALTRLLVQGKEIKEENDLYI